MAVPTVLARLLTLIVGKHFAAPALLLPVHLMAHTRRDLPRTSILSLRSKFYGGQHVVAAPGGARHSGKGDAAHGRNRARAARGGAGAARPLTEPACCLFFSQHVHAQVHCCNLAAPGQEPQCRMLDAGGSGAALRTCCGRVALRSAAHWRLIRFPVAVAMACSLGAALQAALHSPAASCRVCAPPLRSPTVQGQWACQLASRRRRQRTSKVSCAALSCLAALDALQTLENVQQASQLGLLPGLWEQHISQVAAAGGAALALPPPAQMLHLADLATAMQVRRACA